MLLYLGGIYNMYDKIIIKNVDKFYGRKQALKNVNLTIEPGMFGLLGRNGAGKTTLMEILTSLSKKQSGEISVLGIPVEQAREIRSITGYLPQDFSLYPSITVEEGLDYLGVLSGMSKKLRRERAEMLLQQVNLVDCRKKKVKELSGGMRRRLGIAQALLHDPKILIVDEPTAGLDPEERIRFRNLLGEAAQERTVILSTHIVEDVEAVCEEAAILNQGRILWRGTITELISSAQGKVYSAKVSRQMLEVIKKNYIVTGMLSQGEMATVRFLSKEEPLIQGAAVVPPNAEDGYMYCLSQHGCKVMGGDL